MFLQQRQLAWAYLKTFLLAIAAGSLGALAAQGFRWSLETATCMLFDGREQISEIFASLPWYAVVAIPALGGAVAGGFLLAARRVEPPGVSGDYLETIDRRLDHIPVAGSLLRCVSSFFSIVSGGSVGKEGAMVQLSATVTAMVAARFPALRGDTFRSAIAMAATGGLAAVYHTPLAAAVFVAEIAYGGIELRRTGLLFTAAVAAAYVVSLFGQFTPLYNLSAYELELDARVLLAVGVIGAAAGMTGSIFVDVIRFTRSLFERFFSALILRMAVGGLIVGAVLLLAPEVAGNGFEPIAQLLAGQNLSAPLLLILLLKIIATAATVGSGAIGGLFTPSLLVGALVGMAGGSGLGMALGMPDSTVLLGVVGMAAALTATTQAPLMSTLMVLEMTQEPTFVFPLMLAAVIAYGTSNILGQTGTYAVISRHRRRNAKREDLVEAVAGQIMRPAGRVAQDSDSLATARQIGMDQRNRYVFVVTAQQRFIGTVSVHDLIKRAAEHGDAQAGQPTLADLALPDFPIVYADQKVRDIWEAVVNSPAERIPVLQDAGSLRLVGAVYKSDLLEQAKHLFL